MDHSNIPVFKRPTKLPTREELALIFNNKQQKTSSNSTPRILEFTTNNNNDNQQQGSNSIDEYPLNESVLNSVPKNIIPIVHEPNLVSDFFTDLTTDLSDPRLSYQINGILRKFPPPIPPPIPPPTTIKRKSKPLTTKEHQQQQQQQDQQEVVAGDAVNNNNNNNDYSNDYEDEEDEDDEDEYYDDEDDGRGIMIPFIYPPPPVVNYDKLPFSLASFKKKYESLYNINQPIANNGSSTGINQPPKRGRKPKNDSRGVSPFMKSPNYDNENLVYVQALPLPFPPPNYMKYPLNSDKANLLPNKVFNELLEANEELPRIDMVVASAAGSLFEMRQQADKEGFNILGFELDKLNHKKRRATSRDDDDGDSTEVSENEIQGSDDETMKGGDTDDEMNKKVKNEIIRNVNDDDYDEEDVVNVDDEEDEEDGEEEEDDDEEEDGTLDDKKYFLKIDINNYYDYYQGKEGVTNVFEINMTDPKFTKVQRKLSNIKNKPISETYKREEEIEDVYAYPSEAISNLYRIDRDDFFTSSSKELAYASGTNKDRRRLGLRKSVETMEEFEKKYRKEIFQIKKYQLLKRIDDLKNSKIEFNKNLIYDQELKNINEELENQRDVELIQLKILENYELLKNSLNFYNNSNKIYKIINLVLINKLEKLRNFFEFQKKMFQDYIKNKKDIFDLNSKESNKLILGLSNKDYSVEIKEIFKNLIIQDLSNQEQSELSSTIIPELKFDRVDNNKQVLIHDFMPLITPEEFNIITGDLSRKSLSSSSSSSSKNKNSSHKNSSTNNKRIIQSSIYEKLLTSGSDTNLSDSGTGTTTNNNNSTPGPLSSSSNLPKRRTGGRRTGNNSDKNGYSSSGGYGNQQGSNNGSNSNFKTNDLFKEFDTVYSEASILAKIMKQFNGPQMAKPDELINDLELMGIETKWPVHK